MSFRYSILDTLFWNPGMEGKEVKKVKNKE